MSRSVRYTSSPLLASKTPVWRSKFVVAMIALGFSGLVARAAYVQVVANDFFVRQGQIRFARTLELPANRGRILDRHGLLLASSVPTPSIWAFPGDVDVSATQLRQLSQLLEIPEAELSKKFDDEEKNFVWIKRQVDKDVAAKVAALGIKGIYQRDEYKRIYPESEAAAHVVGFASVENNGQEGIELAFNQQLAGRSGSRRVIKDRLSRVVEDVGERVPPVNGRDIVLSIDAKVQALAFQQVRQAVQDNKARAGSVVVLDSRSGEVLALANYPSYQPDKRQNLTGAQLRNMAVTDTFEPGSVMKPFTIGLALETGRVTPSTVIQTAPGSVQITGSTIHDAHPHGALTVAEIIQKSSNVGTVKLAMQMQSREMWELFSQAGFGQKPQLSFPGVVPGRLRPYKTWRPIEQATMSYGYGLSASLFQMARAYTVFAHDGEVIPASLLRTDEPAVGVRVLSVKTVDEIRKMLQMAAGPGGTGPKAQTLGYSVGGKSGTAHKQVGKAYASNKYRAWFVGMAPIDRPRIIVAVMIDEPSAGRYFGGEVAAPVFSEVVQHTLRMMGVQPDMTVRPQVVTQAVEESF
jgi:cell division protein FtsI (penicillin-binding protein 3)